MATLNLPEGNGERRLLYDTHYKTKIIFLISQILPFDPEHNSTALGLLCTEHSTTSKTTAYVQSEFLLLCFFFNVLDNYTYLVSNQPLLVSTRALNFTSGQYPRTPKLEPI